MTSIFPETTAGGLAVRNPDGSPANPANVERAYSPPAAYVTSCPITALPSDCNARIEPRQLNAIVSELVALAECFDPNGPWNCDSLKNLCAAFNVFKDSLDISELVIVSTEPPPDPQLNQLWWENDSGVLYIWYFDGNSGQWVQTQAGAGSRGAGAVDGVSLVGSGAAGDPFRVNIVDCGNY